MRGLKWHHYVGRELLCLLMGHRWRTSWRSRDDRADREQRRSVGLLTYREQREGNPYCWYSAGWHHKCRRCRKRIHGDQTMPLWRVFIGAVRSGWSHALHTASFHRPAQPWREGRFHVETPLHWWLVSLLTAIAAFFGYFYLAFWLRYDLPEFPLGAATSLEWKLMDVVDKRTRYYSWIAPETAAHVGYWLWQSATGAALPDSVTDGTTTGTNGVTHYMTVRFA